MRVGAAADLAAELVALGEEFLAQVSEYDGDLDWCFAHRGDEVAVDAWLGKSRW